MGLGAPRKRAKISNDPNNTTWSRSTTSYGHKMLLSQGWTPGSFLGATNAPHAHLHSDANTSYIRVATKDDNLGLGAKQGTAQGARQCTGLDGLQSLLGRLNGKSEEMLEREQKTRDDLKRAEYATRKFGALRFVSGGVLVGDKILELVEGERARLADQIHPSLNQDISISLQNGQGLPSSHDQRGPLGVPPGIVVGHSRSEAYAAELVDGDLELKSFEQSSEKKKRRAEKAQRKLDRRKQKDTLRGHSHELPTPSDRDISLAQTRLVDIPAVPIQAAAAVFGGRHAVRQRYIQQKKMAMMDPKALNEVCLPLYRASWKRDEHADDSRTDFNGKGMNYLGSCSSHSALGRRKGNKL